MSAEITSENTMKPIWLILFLLAIVAAMPARANGFPAVPPSSEGAPAASAPAAPGAPTPAAPAPAAGAPASPSRREDETVTPEANDTPPTSRLAMVLGAITGRAPAAVTDAQEQIRNLTAQLQERDARISALQARLTEAENLAGAAADYIQGLTNRSVDPVATPPPNQVAAAAVEHVAAAVTAAVQRTGLPSAAAAGKEAPKEAVPEPKALTPQQKIMAGLRMRRELAAKN